MSQPTVHAPEINPRLKWLNSPRPLTLRELRGRVVILDFWTYCCVNCMHVLPVLHRIEERFTDGSVVVIGVHSAKFDGEKNPERILAAAERYEIHHPIVVDEDMDTWSRFAVRSWPTLVVVRPDGTIAAVAPGEPEFEVLAKFIEGEVDAARTRGTLKPGPLLLTAAGANQVGPLLYPGKVAIHGDLIAIADSGHHRILVTDAKGELLHTIGTGVAGHLDGAFDEALFDDPQGLAWKSDTELYVADARSHTVAQLDLSTRTVRTVAGTGELGLGPIAGSSRARTTKIRSPWDLLLVGDALYVALAGSHQIARIMLETGALELVAGTGAESIVDGPFDTATFSQPSGLAIIGDTLYVADSETSAVRAMDLRTREVRTLLGVGLFDFGDIDGPPSVARMQHCLGIAARGGALWVADTYNNKLKQVDPLTGHVTTFAGGLKEPAGLAFHEQGESWLVADTNAHRIVRVSTSGDLLGVLPLRSAPPAKAGRVSVAPAADKSPSSSWFNRLFTAVDGGALAAGRGVVHVRVPAPVGKKFADGAPLDVLLEVSRRSDLLVTPKPAFRMTASGGALLPLEFEVNVEAFPEQRIEAELVIRIDAMVCGASEGAQGDVCEPHAAWIRLPVGLAQTGQAKIVFEAVG